MPALRFSQALTANQLGFNPLTGWQYEYVPAAYMDGAVVKLLVRATTNGVRMTIYAGSTTIVERSPVQGGGTAGVTPSELNTAPDVYIVSPGDRLKVLLDEVLGGTPTVDGIIMIEPQ
jgi:hypothetical protein